jgi:hypothetical protein
VRPYRTNKKCCFEALAHWAIPRFRFKYILELD